jgi:hypothetical protein
MTYEKTQLINIDGTSYQGLIKSTYTELCSIFGQPYVGSGDGKVQRQWALKIADSVIATIYDYKEDTPYRDILVWHVGGKTKDVVQLVEIIMKEQRKLNK